MKTNRESGLNEDKMGDVLYICGKCSREIDKEDKICPHCGARLGKIRCPFCKFTGSVQDFKNDYCPKCGKKKSDIDKYIDKKLSTLKKKKNKSKSISSQSTSLNIDGRTFAFLFIFLLSLTALFLWIFLKYFNII
ncbi:MAG TPA: zinc ribbon domain-containing protein [Spirochaetota bacterium]|nr:zinc ribbon domain-containing protein [Spirochaetota bacterium]HOS33078.1 zinc ribbon domain-containing protein [Spirochaetota bacterium]HOS56333.1 zinc ribbon domain-containing protein [Spirochaetota bacterium]HPK62883.1 zinc ribbon domain-containing protein [Spirochaetota bacterium]HQF78781.1 zinc ribbon domain-containing protein [Spirochaetota bacterium]